MSYTDSYEETYTHFSDEEDKLIQEWLTKQGYTWSTNTVCGNCCGMYEDEYWVNGIGGKFPENKRKAFLRYALDKKIGCRIYGYTIEAYDGEAHIDKY